MLKLIGVIAVIASGSMTGFSMSERFGLRCRTLRNITEMLDQCRILLKYNACTISELAKSLSSCRLFRQMSFEMPDDPLRVRDMLINCSLNQDLELSSDERERLTSFFAGLGTTDLEGQLSTVERYSAYFNACYIAAAEKRASKCRLYQSLGVLGGIFLAVIII